MNHIRNEVRKISREFNMLKQIVQLNALKYLVRKEKIIWGTKSGEQGV